jgi:hypothetical protein
MGPNLIAAIASVVVILITVIGQWINSRNDRSLTNQELDILQKLDNLKELDANPSAARELSEVIQFRIAKWHDKTVKSERFVRRAWMWAAVSWMLLMVGDLAYSKAFSLDLLGNVLLVLAFAAFLAMVYTWLRFSKERSNEKSRGAVPRQGSGDRPRADAASSATASDGPDTGLRS